MPRSDQELMQEIVAAELSNFEELYAERPAMAHILGRSGSRSRSRSTLRCRCRRRRRRSGLRCRCRFRRRRRRRRVFSGSLFPRSGSFRTGSGRRSGRRTGRRRSGSGSGS